MSSFASRDILQNRLHTDAMSQESKDVLHCKSCTSDDSLPPLSGVYSYPFQQLFVVHNDAI